MTARQLAEKAWIYDGIFDRWIESADFEERELFVRNFLMLWKQEEQEQHQNLQKVMPVDLKPYYSQW